MLLFVNKTSEDIIDVFDADTLKRIGRIEYSCRLHDGKAGPRSGIEFRGKAIVANCYDNTISVIDPYLMEEIKVIATGSYPISVISDGNYIFAACGDSDSIWVIDDNLDVFLVDTTVKFPFCMAASEKELCICGFTGGEICIYDRHSLEPVECFTLKGYPMGAVYLKDELLIAYNMEYEGMIFFRNENIKIGTRVGKAVSFKDRAYICVDDNRIIAIDDTFKTIIDICVQEAIGDFTVSSNGIFVSTLLKGSIIKFSHKGEVCGKINMESSTNALFLLS